MEISCESVQTIEVNTESEVITKTEEEENKKTYFECSSCVFRTIYEYFGREPPKFKGYKLLENAYVIENPFIPPKQNNFIVIGAHCVKCEKTVCKDDSCSFYYVGTYCLECAKKEASKFPSVVQEKFNKILSGLVSTATTIKK